MIDSNMNGQALVNAQCEVNRAVFLMNAQANRNIHPYSTMDDESFEPERFAKLIANAITELQRVQQSLPGQEDLFA